MAVRTPDPGKARVGIAAVEVALDHLFDDRPEIPVLLLEASLILGQEPLEMMEKHPIEDRALRMTKAIDSRHIGKADSRSMPEASKRRSEGRESDPSTNSYTHVSRH